jgi:hypothetical protein
MIHAQSDVHRGGGRGGCDLAITGTCHAILNAGLSIVAFKQRPSFILFVCCMPAFAHRFSIYIMLGRGNFDALQGMGIAMRLLHVSPLQAVVMFSLGVVVGGGFLGGFSQPQNRPEVATTSSVAERCASGDAVADFVCRNTWLANTRHAYR